MEALTLCQGREEMRRREVSYREDEAGVAGHLHVRNCGGEIWGSVGHAPNHHNGGERGFLEGFIGLYGLALSTKNLKTFIARVESRLLDAFVECLPVTGFKAVEPKNISFLNHGMMKSIEIHHYAGT